MINNPIIYKFFKNFTNHRKKTKRAVVFSCSTSPTFLNTLNTGTTDETFQQSGKQDSFRHILKSSASIHVQNLSHSSLEPPLEYYQDLDKSRFIMTFLTILGVTEILCSFRLVLEGKTGKEIPDSSQVLRKVFSKHFCFIRCRRQHLWAIE